MACADALLSAGATVTMLDVGISLEEHRRPLVARMSSQVPEQWTDEDLDAYRTGMKPEVGGVPLKLAFGSDFAYREAVETLDVAFTDAGVRPSFALGGLSNVWGAAMLPYTDADIDDWPFGPEALASHYAAVLRLTGLAGTHDALADVFPLYTDDVTELPVGRQARRLLDTMERRRDRLDSAGIRFGQSRLAVRSGDGRSGGCVHCRLCMYGCPYDLIYSSAQTVDHLRKHPSFRYIDRVVVRSVSESSDGVTVSGHRLGSDEVVEWHSDRAFLAAGAIPTTQILLRSLGAYDTWVTLKDSQYFLLPLLTRRSRGATSERTFSLAQLFVELPDPVRPDRNAHIQLYSNSDLINAAVEELFGRLGPRIRPILKLVEERLVVAQGFLHSDSSSTMEIRLRSGSDGRDRLEVRARVDPRAAISVKRVARALARRWRSLGAIPVTPLMTVAEPGRSFHCGGTFPMSNSSGRHQSDLLGRTGGWERIHAVDSTVFPSVPATTITLTAMANAHRIGALAAEIDGVA